MPAASPVKWSMEADYLQACSCDYGCPCEFEAPPTQGFCEGVGAWRINRGRYGDVPLDGLSFGFAARWPQEMHKGGGAALLLFDEKANPQQRDALLQICSGKAGGMPFEIIVMTISDLQEPQFVPFQWNLNGRNSTVKIGNAVNIAVEPIKNPVTGEPENVAIDHGTGFIFKRADVVSARECRASGASPLDFSWPDKAGFVTRVQYGN